MHSTLVLLLEQYKAGLANGHHPEQLSKKLVRNIQLASAQFLPPQLHDLPLLLLKVFDIQEDCTRVMAGAKGKSAGVLTEDIEKLHKLTQRICDSLEILGKLIALPNLEINEFVTKTNEKIEQIEKLLFQQVDILNTKSSKKQKINQSSIDFKSFATQQTIIFNEDMNAEISRLKIKESLIDLDNQLNLNEKNLKKFEENTLVERKAVVNTFRQQACEYLIKTSELLQKLKDVAENKTKDMAAKQENQNKKPSIYQSHEESLLKQLFKKLFSLFQKPKPEKQPAKPVVIAPSDLFVDISLTEEPAQQHNKASVPTYRSKFFASPEKVPNKNLKPQPKLSFFSRFLNLFKNRSSAKPSPVRTEKTRKISLLR